MKSTIHEFRLNFFTAMSKKLLLLSAILILISGCSFVKDVQSHCKPSINSGDIQTGSFNVCLKCDSLAKVVYSNIKKQIEKK